MDKPIYIFRKNHNEEVMASIRKKEANKMSQHIRTVCLLKKRIIEEIRGGRVFFDGYDQSEANKQFYIAIGRENEKGDFIVQQRILFGVQHLSALKEVVLELEAEDAAWLEHG